MPSANAAVATVAHRFINRERERARGDQRHGSCGLGIGECRHMARCHLDLTIFAKDLSSRTVCRDKLQAQAEHYGLSVTLPAFLEYADKYQEVAQELQLSATGLSGKLDCAIFEGAQGVLLDEHVGFHPYTTWSTVTLDAAREPLEAMGIRDVHHMGILRSLATRHGAGPFPGWRPDMRLLSDHNVTNPWQGPLRVGYHCCDLLAYASRHCGGPLHSLAVTWLDYLSPVIVHHDYWQLEELPNDGRRADYLLSELPPTASLSVASSITEFLEWIERCFHSHGAKVSSLSFGPTWHHKTIFDQEIQGNWA